MNSLAATPKWRARGRLNRVRRGDGERKQRSRHSCACENSAERQFEYGLVPPRPDHVFGICPEETSGRCETLRTADLPFELQTSWGAIRGETSMPRSHTNSPRSDGIWPKPLPVREPGGDPAGDLGGGDFGIDRALDASRSRIAASRDAPVSAVPGHCPQLAETFDSERAACLRRRWSAMRDMRPWRDTSRERAARGLPAVPGGEIRGPLQDQCLPPSETSSRLQRAQN